MSKNAFMTALDEDLNDTFYNLDEFGVEVEYRAGGVAPGTIIQGIFDSDPNNSFVENSDTEFIDNRPKVRLREVDLINGYPDTRSDVFVINDIEYSCDEYDETRTGEVLCYLEVV